MHLSDFIIISFINVYYTVGSFTEVKRYETKSINGTTSLSKSSIKSVPFSVTIQFGIRKGNLINLNVHSFSQPKAIA